MAERSSMVTLGSPPAPFRLPDTEGGEVALADLLDAPAILVMFICNHCPFVKHVQSELARLTEAYQRRGVAVVGINANDAERYPEDGPEAMAEEARRVGYTFPYLYDASQEVAKAYGAACTPDLFVYGPASSLPEGAEAAAEGHVLVYRGQMDGARPGNDVAVDGVDLRAALDAVLTGERVTAEQMPSVGCSIKWRPGNEPG